MALKTHSLKDWVITLGPNILSGFSEDDALSVEFPNDMFDAVEGADGNDHTRAYNPNWKRANVTITLQDSSASNAALQAAILLDGLTQVAVLPFAAKNTKTGQGYIGKDAYFQKQPDATVSRTSQTREWQLIVPELLPNEAGIA